LEDVSPDQTKLPGFKWLDDIRPKTLADIYGVIVRGKQKRIPRADDGVKKTSTKNAKPLKK
jgi:ribonucleotide monophosphatase NagD (HAD superfamily)